MLSYATRRLVLSIPTLLFISFVIFMLLQLAPGDPMAQVPLTVPPEVKQKMREALGLGEPPLVQYWKWLVQVFWTEPKVFIDWAFGTSETVYFNNSGIKTDPTIPPGTSMASEWIDMPIDANKNYIVEYTIEGLNSGKFYDFT